MPKDYKRNENGTIIKSANNMSKMNIFEYSWYYLRHDYWTAIRSSFVEFVQATMYFIVMFLVVITFPISMPIFATLAIRRNKKFVKEHSPKS